MAVGVIRDDRPYHFDYEEETDDPTGYGALVPSAFQKQQATKAAADVLKANFNPNLHLNELNPDENLFTLVDKTDLFVNSTEFCFLPTGYFRVDSVGRVVRPKDLAADAFLSTDNELVAQAKVTSVVQLYNVHRETSQHQFYPGQLSIISGVPDTNSGLSLEIGPEPDNGVFPGNLGAPGDPNNEWDGYIALPTVGGVWHSSPLKPKNTLRTTAMTGSSPHLNSAMHVHYTLDTDAHHHIIDPREIAGPVLPDETVRNHPDLNLTYGGPYDPTRGGAGSPHRLCRSFRQTGGGGSPTLSRYAPSDLRIDGAYSERHAAPSYYVRNSTAGIWNFSTDSPSGMVSFWYKPSFFPELTGRIRKVWDMSRYHQLCRSNIYVWPFELLFMPVHYNSGFAESNQPRFWNNNMGQFHPSSMSWGSKQWHDNQGRSLGADSHQFGRITKSLNHLGHADEAINPSVLRGHRWIHTTFRWDQVPLAGQNSQMFINGDMSQIPFFSHQSMTGWSDRLNKMWNFEVHDPGEFNQMRFGSPSEIAQAAKVAGVAFRGNHPADFTIDEIYVWQNAADSPDPNLIWNRGRYTPPDAQNGEGRFTSQPLPITPAQPGSGQASLLGVSWTWYGEENAPLTDSQDQPRLYDYQGTVGTGGTDLQPNVRVTGFLDGALLHPTDLPPLGEHNDGFAAVQATGGGPVPVQDPTQVKYVAEFTTNGSFGSILLATPVLDDVTIYWNDGRSNTVVETSTSVSVTGPSSPLPVGTEGVAYPTTAFTASGSAPMVWSTTGTLPPGMSLDAAGVYSGTPTTAGTYAFSATVTNPLGSETRVYSHTINAFGNPDTDGDGLPDAWEQTYFGDLTQGPGDDLPDQDGLTNLEEYQAGTDPTVADTDGDGLTDGEEVNTHGTDPNDSDTDNDGLSDGEEVNTHGTDPTVVDSDGDGMSDQNEVLAGFDPTNSDQDGNQTPDGQDDWDNDGTLNQFDLTPGSAPSSAAGGGGGGGGGCGHLGLEVVLLWGLFVIVLRRLRYPGRGAAAR